MNFSKLHRELTGLYTKFQIIDINGIHKQPPTYPQNVYFLSENNNMKVKEKKR